MDEDPFQRWIYFLTFIESLDMIFYQHKETCEVFLYYQKIGGEDIKYFVKKAIGNILHANIDVHSRRLIAQLPGDRVKFISNIQSHYANMNFAYKSRHDRLFHQVTHKGGESEINYTKRFQNTPALTVSIGHIYSEDQ